MKEIIWIDDLLIGVNVIDKPHKQLIQHLNNLNKAVEEPHGPSQIGSTLEFLIDYTDFHFSEEEKQMEANNYSGLDNQKIQHEKFKTTLADLERDLVEDGATHELAGLIDTLLGSWLVNHICTVDVAFGEFLNKSGIKESWK